jgi:DNA gyrase/topoisomerase IV subunit A
MNKERISSKTISQHIDGPYREFALYTIENRGIPNFYDSLTNVQRLILLHTPSSYVKTIGLIGQVFSTGLYHHSDGSMSNVVNRMAKPYAVAHNILDGDGFFGSILNPVPAASRYTSVKINPTINKIINENKVLNTPDFEGAVNRLNIEFPIGLLTHILGIAVGYSTNILPRKLEHVLEYLEGKRTELVPYFVNFSGTVDKFQRGWIISGKYEVNERNKSIKITEIPPILKISTILDKLSSISEEIPIHVVDNSTNDKGKTVISLEIRVMSQSAEVFEKFRKIVDKFIKLGFTENLTFIKDGRIVQYDKVEDYLDDFWFESKSVKQRKYQYDIKDKTDETEFLNWKIKFIDWIIKKKSGDEPEKWLLENPPKEIQPRLAKVTASNLNINTIALCKEEINSLQKEIVELNKNLEIITKLITKRTTGYVSKSKVTINKELADFDSLDIEEYQPDLQETETEEIK